MPVQMWPDDEKEFVSLLAEHQSMLRGFVISLMPGIPGADDVVQETNQVLWVKRDNFEIGTNFRAWALRIARFQVMAHLQGIRRQGWVSLTERGVELVSEEMESFVDTKLEDARLCALRKCLQKLFEKDRDLLLRRYWRRQRLQDFCAITGLSLANIKVKLFRLRAVLKKCVCEELKEVTS